ncbi:tRNA 2-thiocytidine biosynthesis protein TtcA [Enterococcus sp. MJM12]|uniref:tRNA 2-thiocytidine biosynthesis protein TtcA n=1 Tax=Candidatus Enterococcus myersii TaxID=2815322 RepID=A0ABS3H4C6_9ENTE|nr:MULTISPECIES: tRNA 2-thiocytidine biosynthesis TtcA family protein [unclassified Enterococcus]MBO0448276.1 tRNA 2-thiocytidine biosynthesis protein TtcA [Enterococcus sp. MJM12]MCD1024119.1 tRNA 2-thiocytidine biosynthesis TtcA family protein [Enterococcus sp. SMC-9]
MSFKKKDNQLYYNPIRRAILNHQLIEAGDKVAIGLSGGKDSTSLLYFLDTISKQERLGFPFEIVPISLDMGFEDVNLQPLIEFCQQLGYPLEVVPTKIAEVVFDVRKEASPCSLCAKLRRGILYNKARELGCNKVALGHHLDDAIETYFMNFLFHGKLNSFEPKSYLSKTEVTLIRPLLYIPEQEIIRFVKREALPVIFNPCPADKKTKREEIKIFVENIAKTYPDVRQKFLMGMEQGTKDNFWPIGK